MVTRSCLRCDLPRSAGELISLSTWENLFILGANGTGKSSLMQQLYRPHFANAMDIGTSPNLVFFQRNDFIAPGKAKLWSIFGQRHQSRVALEDDYATQRASIAIMTSLTLRTCVLVQLLVQLMVTMMQNSCKERCSYKDYQRASTSFDIPMRSLSESDQVVASKCGGIPIALRSSQTGT